jgi:two-component system, chemotaxis family, response regulator PixG
MQPSAFSLETMIHQTLDPSQVIQQYLQDMHTGCLIIKGESVSWFAFVDFGQLMYITQSVEPIDRLDSQLRRLSRRIPDLTADVRTHIRLSLEPTKDLSSPLRPDIKGISLLIEEAILSEKEICALLLEMSREALESLLLSQEHTYTFVNTQSPFYIGQPIDFGALVLECRQRIAAWQAFAPHLWSPYQRPYLFSQSQSNKLTPERQAQLGKLLKGFSFRHLAILLDQDELKLIRSLYPLIADKAILLRDPQPPYDALPNFSNLPVQEDTSSANISVAPLSEAGNTLDSLPQASTETQTYRVACIDDSPAMLQTIEQFLGKENLSLFLINESVKALIEVMRIKPDLILLDVGMPKVDGYELCRLLRKHTLFRSTPIIMVTGNTGLIDRARAKLVGATDYMTKPFTQHELLKMVFRYLS